MALSHLRLLPRLEPDHTQPAVIMTDSLTYVARHVLANPQDYSDARLRDACNWLRDEGDWIDQGRARQMLKAMDRQLRLQAESDHWFPGNMREAVIMGLIVLVAVIGIAVGDVVWGQYLAAGVVR